MTTTALPKTCEHSRPGPSMPASDEGGLSIPKHLWAAPVNEGRRRQPPPRLSRLVLIFPIVAPVSAYLAAVAAAHGHVHAGGWLLGLAVTAILSSAVVLGVHAHRVARYRAEAPR